MWHKFDDDLRRTILNAPRHRKSKDEGLATRHLLTQLIAESEGVSHVLARLGVTPGAVAQELGRAEEAEGRPDGMDSALTPQARSVVDQSYALAVELGDSSIGCGHLLLALVREPGKSDAGRALARLGVTWESAGGALMAVQRRRTCPPSGVRVPGLPARKTWRRLKDAAGRLKLLAYAVSHPRQPLLSVLLARKQTTRNPYPFYARLRRRPIFWEPLTGEWFVTGYEDVVAALAEPRLSQRVFAPSAWAHGELPPWVQRDFRRLQGTLDRQMLFRDVPEQIRQRSLLARRFTPRVISGMRDHLQDVADRMLDDAAPQGRMDVVADLAVPFPLLAIMRMLGLPPDQRPRFKKWSEDYITYLTFESTLAEDVAAYHSVLEATDYFQGLIAERRAAPQCDTSPITDDLITLLLRPDAQGERLPDEEVVANCLLLLAAGNETVVRLIGSGVLALLRRPDQWRRLREDPALTGPAVEEMLRYDSPVQWSMRCLTEDLEWRGHELKKGQWMHVGLAAANRDPAQFPDPDRFDITRTEGRHVAFGHGPHFCLGAALARMEAQVVFGALAARFPRLRLDEPPAFPPAGLAFRGPTSLRVRWDEG